MKKICAVGVGLMMMWGCNNAADKTAEVKPEKEKLTEPIHSFALPNEAVVKHLNLDVEVNFEDRKISGWATYDIETAADAKKIVFDVHGLEILKVKVDEVEVTDWWVGPEKEFMGQALEVNIAPSTKKVSVEYATTDKAEALQWLNPQQTAGKEQPFLFTQSQAILARTWLPCQDSPGIRYTYEATVKVPSGLLALMSAENPTEVDSSGVYTFKMDQPIPSYLMALSVGELEFKAIGDRTGVYAEPSMLEASAYEFADMQKMLESAEGLYGTYAWERYDVIVLPPSFPFGGMENPRLTFATPTILAGDRSLTALVAHELAHSWSGNLVTNATWNDFWLNEGFTVYFERRIMEDVYGKNYANMLASLGWQDLQSTLKSFESTPDETKLKLDLEDRNPDDGMTEIAYEKGYFFLRTLEENLGRERFDAFLNMHFSSNAFKTLNTEKFLENLKAQLLDGNEESYNQLKINEWVYEPGIPDNCVKVESDEFAQVEAQLESFLNGAKPAELTIESWTTHHWLHFLRNVPETVSMDQMSDLDKAFGFTETGNSEIACEWFVLSIEQDYNKANTAIEAFLIQVGRRKFLSPIYVALVEADPSMERARAIYTQARPNYHSVSTNTLDALLKVSQ